ncbi:MltA domain-containing protein [Waterburya agarophytonicola K14]|uniref:peptidoglycan lytic exotransglycosylase n=1 Tax=Waterburya agarophytonicola KI4 TaxID=2874699 RepID=A0A964BMH6_9CYAN|nr:MltA domain-containing protein [Waterburya agarophytonicola]MCC0176073.1 MltA domain-containing protein [Waterburya agarophytonicola KI4]
MIRSVSSFCLGLSIVAVSSLGQVANAQVLRQVSTERIKYVGLDDKLGNSQPDSDKRAVYRWNTNPSCPAAKPKAKETSTWNKSQRQALEKAIDHSLYYLSTPKAARTYRKYTKTKFNLAHTRRSLLRFKELLLTTDSPQALEKAVKEEFAFYQSVGKDKRGKVEFTGYFEPTYTASRVRTAEYPYPLYRQPPNFKRWSRPHPTRAQLEGKDGLAQGKSLLRGHELVWLSDRLEAFLVQVQGSAKLKMTDGTTMTVGYNGTTNYHYVSVGGELVKDGVFGKDELTLPKLLAYFAQNPQKLDEYIPRNNRFIFFRETNGKAPTGNLGVPVTGDRSIATDKSLMPPGALALIVAPIPDLESTGEIETRVVSRYVLDQDTGSAIKGAGRVDIFLGSGETAGERAGRLNGSGNLFYLLLK